MVKIETSVRMRQSHARSTERGSYTSPKKFTVRDQQNGSRISPWVFVVI